MKIKRFAFAFAAYTVSFLIVVSLIGQVIPESTNGFLTLIVMLCIFGIPNILTFFALHAYDRKIINPNNSVTPVNSSEHESQLPISIEKPAVFRSSKSDAFAEKEADLERREAELVERKKKFDIYVSEKGKELSKAKADADAARSKLRIEISNNQQTINEINRQNETLIKTELRLFSWAKKREEDEILVFNEIQEKAEKFSVYSNISPNMDGFKFEKYVASVLDANGYSNIDVTQKSGDFGGDITATLNNVRYVFQCKYYTSSPVGIAAVQEIYSAKSVYSAHVAVVVTNSVYTKAAQILADEVGVILWDGEELAKMSANKAK